MVMYVPDVAPNFGSGGGFSNFYSTPSYQAKAVQNYLDKYAPE